MGSRRNKKERRAQKQRRAKRKRRKQGQERQSRQRRSPRMPPLVLPDSVHEGFDLERFDLEGLDLEGLGVMSEMLLTLAEPHLDCAEDLESAKRLFFLTMIGWNTALLPEDERRDSVEWLMDELCGADERDRADLWGIIKDFVVLKKAFYPDVNRFIVDVHVTETRDEFHVRVLSMVPEGWEPTETLLEPVEEGDAAEARDLSRDFSEFMAPYLDLEGDYDVKRLVCALGMLGWNMLLVPEERQAEMLDDVLESLFDGTPEELPWLPRLVVLMAERKRELYPDDSRLITGIEFEETSDGYKLVVEGVSLEDGPVS